MQSRGHVGSRCLFLYMNTHAYVYTYTCTHVFAYFCMYTYRYHICTCINSYVEITVLATIPLMSRKAAATHPEPNTMFHCYNRQLDNWYIMSISRV
jgi:hypothetical protein